MSAADFTAWLGRTEEAQDQLSRNLIKRIAATFGEDAPAHGAALPPLWQWCFFQEPVAESQLGTDGHPARGGFLPPADDRNRMWAGGRIEFIEPLRVGADAHRLSTITHIEEKIGRTGALLFVTVRHDYSQDGRLAIREEQDIVYREPSPPKLAAGDPVIETQWSESVVPDSLLLFRYSALSFNSHRIHYDWPYVTETEGYPGLVVQGPLTATMNLAAFVKANPLARMKHFSFRGVRPLIAPAPILFGGRHIQHGTAELWASDANGISQYATIEFD